MNSEVPSTSGYLSELRLHARPLLAATLGAGTSLPLFAYTNGIFAPYLIRQFGWSKSQFALIGLTMLASVVFLPLIGRLADRYGVRKVALTGTILVPLCFVAYALQTGSFAYFVTVYAAVVLFGNLTSPMVYSRLVAARFRRATGLALTIMNCFPAALAIGLVPALNRSIETWGWRPSYIAVGLVALAGNVVALLLIRQDDEPRPAGAAPEAGRCTSPQRREYGAILRSGVFWLIAAAMFLCLLITPLHTSQMSLMLMENRMSAQTAAFVISIYSTGTIVGRIGCGLALDRFPTPLVTCISMALPAAGLFLLASQWDAVPVIATGMFLVGLTVGAESDLLAFLAARYFRLEIFSTAFSLIACVNYAAAFVGSIAISLVLARTGQFAPYLLLTGVTVACGSLMFLLLPWSADRARIG